MTLHKRQLQRLYIAILLSVASIAAAPAAETTEENLKAAFTYNFLRYIEWPNEKDRSAFQLFYYGDNNLQFNALKSLQNSEVRGRKIEVTEAKKLSDLANADIIYVGKKRLRDLRRVNSYTKRSPILVIADKATEKQLFGINFVESKTGGLKFEVNRYNLVHRNLKVSSDIVILGGTEVEIAAMVSDMEADLDKSRAQLSQVQQQVLQKQNELDKKSEEVKTQSALIESHQAQLKKLDQTINVQKSAFEALQAEYSTLRASLESSRKELTQNNQLLGTKQEELAQKSVAIDNLAELIEKNKNLLIEQSAELEQQKSELLVSQAALESQQDTLNRQTLTIKNQTLALYGSIVLILCVGITVIVIYRGYQNKKQSHVVLENKNEELEKINRRLTETQGQLVEAEKMAALGSLVAGVAHEINTPIGVGVTSVSHLLDSVEEFKAKYESGEMKRSELEQLLEDLNESGAILSRNLTRASELIRSFKQVSTDQTNEEIRTFGLEQYLKEICQNLHHKLKQKGHSVKIKCDKAIDVCLYPGAFAQIMTNLIVNSIIHGFGDLIEKGRINVDCQVSGETLIIHYRDNGKGIPENQIDKVFDPFFTTNRAEGGTGLGLHICFNLVTQKLKGTIQCKKVEQGAEFMLQMPLSLRT